MLFFTNQSCKKTIILTFISLVILYVCLRIFGSIFNHFELNIILNNILISLFFYVLILFLSGKDLAIWALSLLGKLSFSMYLVHFAVIHWIDKLGYAYLVDDLSINYLLRLSIILLLTLIISYFTYYFVENPMRYLGKRMIKYWSESKNF